MQLFIYEYVSCQRDGLPTSLRDEGLAMLSALLEDAARLPELSVSTLTARPLPAPPGVTAHLLAEGTAEEELFATLCRAADLTLVVAPETDGVLRARHDWVQALGGTWLGCSGAAIDLTTDKLALSAHWEQQGIPTPTTRELDMDQELPAACFPLIHKPRDGAGSQATFRATNRAELAAGLAQVGAEGWSGSSIVQPCVPGEAASVAVLVGPRQVVPLPPAWQRLSADGRFHYLRSDWPLPGPLAERARRLALRAVAAVPGLLGYVGVDLVLGPAVDGSLDQAIEINPRLTTSYAGLRTLTTCNLLERMLHVWHGTPVDPLATEFVQATAR